MLRFLQLLLFFGLNQVTTFAKTMCNQDSYGNCIENKCVTWFDGNHTCDIIYENNTLVNMTCSDTLCKGNNHVPLCIKPGYHLNSTCDLVPDTYEMFLILPLFFMVQLFGFVFVSIYCAPLQRFSTKLTEIDKDMGTTCLTCWCPCITFGEIFQHIYDVPSVFGCLLYTFCGSFRCCFSILNRWGIRKKYNINGEPDKDFLLDVCIHCWAHPCALCQERRELMIHRNDIESRLHSPIVPQRTHPSQQSEPPAILVMASRVDNKPVVINASLLETVSNNE
jgi:Cys-rich protein (TIGR01571 family)